MKKILSLVLAMLMIFSIVPAAFAAETSEDSTYAEALDFLAAVGFYKGGAGVADDDAITRWQMALFVSRLVTGEVEDSYWATTENDSGFTDVDALEAYMLGAVTFAAQEGIINGYGDGTFGPNDGITYRDALVMTVRALGTKYSASGYPWSYIATARELGLMNEINGIGWTDEITREVVAQILYNAFFAEVKGTTVAEKVFNIACDTVMVTASNRVVYETNGVPVLATDYVQIMAVDETLEPTGTQYHVKATTLGLNDDNAENGAVGMLYKVWYRNNFNTIVMYEDLNTTYTNRPGDQQVTYNSSKRGIAINGKFLKTVAEYTNLFNQDRPNFTAAGDPEVKLFMIGLVNNSNLQTVGTKYVMYPDGWIYRISDLVPVGYYSEYLNTWYTYNAATKEYGLMVIDAAGSSTATVNDIYKDLHNGLLNPTNGRLGFGQCRNKMNDTANSNPDVAKIAAWAGDFSVYADVHTSDADGDGNADRALIKNYHIGWYDEFQAKCTTNNSSNHTHFAITVGPDGSNDYDDFGKRGLVNEGCKRISVTEPVFTVESAHKADYNFVGETPVDGSFIVYYLDVDNKELDVAKVIKAKDANSTDTYYTTGYLLSFFQSQRVVYFNDATGTVSLPIGWSEMYGWGAPLYSFGHYHSSSTATVDTARNNARLVDFLLPLVEAEQYVTYYVLDGHVIYIENANPTTDYVIIDSYADISADGIKVNAWSTVSNQYDVITIAEFNGWDINGVEWDALWQTAIYQAFATGKMPSMTDLLAKYVPIKFGEVYAVVSADTEKNYNITTRFPAPQDEVDVIVAGGFVHHTHGGDGKVDINGIASGVYVLETAANDFWLVKEQLQDATGAVIPGEYKVYGRTGKLANVVFNNVDVYKADASTRDFVIEGTTAELADFLKQVDVSTSDDIRFAVYERTNLFGSTEDFEYTNGTLYNQYFQDVITGSDFIVEIDPAKESEIRDTLKANAKADSGKVNTIYKIVDGKLTDTTPVDMAEVAAYVIAKKTYTNVATYVPGADITLANLMKDVNSEFEKVVMNNPLITNEDRTNNVYIDKNNLTYLYLDNADHFQYGIRYYATEKGMTDLNSAHGNDTLTNVKAYIFYNDAATTAAHKAVVYIDYGVAEGSVELQNVAATNGEGGPSTAKYDTEIEWSYNDNIDGEALNVDIITAVGEAGGLSEAFANGCIPTVLAGDATMTATKSYANGVISLEIAAPQYPAAYTIVLTYGQSSVTYEVTIG